MVASNTEWIIFISFTIFSWLCLVPFSCLCIFKFFQHRHHIIIQKREPKLLLILATFYIFSIGVERPVYLLTHTTNNVANEYIVYAHVFCYHVITFPIAYILMLKYWLIFFSVNWIKNTMNQKWKIHLNENTTKQNWYLQNKSTFGKLEWNLKRLSIIFISCIVPVSIATTIHNSYVWITIIQLLLNMGPILIIFVLFHKISKHKDDFYIMKEFKIITCLIIFAVLRYIIIGIVLPVFGIDIYFRYLFLAIFTGVMSAVSLYFQTLFVVHTMQSKLVEKQLTDIIKPKNAITTSTSKTTTRSRSQSECYMNLVRMRETFKNETMFELFMEHINREWSMELVLALIELTHLQSLIKKIWFDDNYDITLSVIQISLLQNAAIPQSFIVYTNCMKTLFSQYTIGESIVGFENMSKMKEFKIKSYVLYRKYIVAQSEFQINISWRQKKRLEELMNDVSKWVNHTQIKEKEMFLIYSDVVREIKKLLNGSYRRFTSSNSKNRERTKSVSVSRVN